jgi:hypothetical protein
MNDAAGTRHVTIDPYQAGRFANCGLQFLEEAGVIDLIEYHAEESQTVRSSFAMPAVSISPSSTETTASTLCSWTWCTWDDWSDRKAS